jgi:LPXTG-motif cell wall-anchored protein
VIPVTGTTAGPLVALAGAAMFGALVARRRYRAIRS